MLCRNHHRTLNQLTAVKEVKNMVEDIHPKIETIKKDVSEVKKAVEDSKTKMNKLVSNENNSLALLSQMRTRLCATTNLVTEALKVKHKNARNLLKSLH